MEIVDWLDREGLIDKYQSMGLDTSKIEEVDYIWDGRSYEEVTGKCGSYD